jgi:hypothetical protein
MIATAGLRARRERQRGGGQRAFDEGQGVLGQASERRVLPKWGNAGAVLKHATRCMDAASWSQEKPTMERLETFAITMRLLNRQSKVGRAALLTSMNCRKQTSSRGPGEKPIGVRQENSCYNFQRSVVQLMQSS